MTRELLDVVREAAGAELRSLGQRGNQTAHSASGSGALSTSSQTLIRRTESRIKHYPLICASLSR